MGCRFNLAKSTLHHCFVRVIFALNKIAPKIIRWPNQDERISIKQKFKKIGNFQGVIGAIDGTYVPIKAPQNNPTVYINRKCFFGVTLQAIATSDLKFIDCFCGYPSSVSDARIFRNSDVYSLMNEAPSQLFSEGEYILGDKAYPDAKYCVPPFIERGNFMPQHRQFNYLHAKSRQVVERSFSLLFGRFRRLNYLNMSRMDLLPSTVIACCVLHNVCLSEPQSLKNNLEAPEKNLRAQQPNVMVIANDENNLSKRAEIFQDFIDRNIIRLG